MSLRFFRAYLLLLVLPLLAQNRDPLDPQLRPPADVEAVPGNVWVTNAMAKVQPNASPGSGRFADLHAARNEFESFQIHVHAGSAAMHITATPSDLAGAGIGGGAQIPASPNIAVFSESYINVTTPSDLNGITGLVPDPLVPGVDPYFHEKRNGFPLTIPPGETRSIWVDVFVPASAHSGFYNGTVTLNDGSSALAKIPVRLAVWNFTLPSTATLKSAFGMGYTGYGYLAYGDYAGVAKYPGSGGSSDQALALIHAAISSFFLEHRVTIGQAVVEPTSPNGQWSAFDQVYGPLMNGQANTPNSGAKLTTLQYPNGQGTNVADLKDYTSHFNSMSWLPRLFVYQCDEPPAGCPWATMIAGGNAVHSNAPGLSTLVTTSIDKATANNALGAIDILVPVVDEMDPMGGSNQRSKYDAWLMNPGKQLWWYQSCDEHISCDNGKPGPKTSTWPTYMIDASPVRNRVFQWMAYLYQIQGELYYQVDLWQDNPWDHLYFAGGNGDGALYYPGVAAQIGGSTPIPISSIRLKLIRDGMEDFEYLAALDRAGKGQLATQIAHSFITNAYTFKDDPAALESARIQLGTALHQLSLGLQQ